MSLISTITDSESNRLTIALVKAINDSIAGGKDEPSIVARLTQYIPLHCSPIKNIGPYQLSVGGVFVHQTPKVTFDGIKKQKSIELGDLLLISTVKSLSGEITRKAMLLQAKMFDLLPINSTSNDNQHMLYREWPVYEYCRSGPDLNNRKRYIFGHDMYPAAKYLLLRKGFNPSGGWPHWIHSHVINSNALSAFPTTPLSSYECFTRELYGFVLSDKGKKFDLMSNTDYEDYCSEHQRDIELFDPYHKHIIPITDKNGWSLMINDLLRVTASLMTKVMGKAVGVTDELKRGVNVVSYANSMDKESALNSIKNMHAKSDDVPPTNNQIEPGDDEPEGGGISVIEFILTESENPQEMRPDEQAE